MEQVEPVLADHRLDARGLPAALFHRRGQVRPFADGAQPFGIDDVAEIGQAAGIAFVVGNPVEEFLAVPLREIGADADIALAADVDHVFDRLDVIIDIGGRAALQERRKHGDADEAAVVDDEFQLFVALVARMRLQTGRQAVRIGHRLLGGENHILAGLCADMGEVAEDAEPVHLGDDLAAEIRQTAVFGLVAAGADQVLGVVGHLDDADAEFFEQAEIADLVLDPRNVLPAEDDAGLALFLGLQNVGGGINLLQDVAVFAKPGLPAHHIAHRFGKAFPDAAGAVGGGQAALPHVLEDRTPEIGDDQSVNDNRRLMQI